MNDNALVPYSDLQRMAGDIVKAGLFPGIKTVEQALTLFLVAQAEGLHPMTATMRYNIIQNRPAMKAEAMLASFIERGGTVDWTEYTDEAVTGFFQSAGVPKGVSVRWTMADAKRAGVTMNQTWTKYPRQMLKARVASDGVRMTDPAVNQGRYTPEEVREFTPAEIVAPEPPEEDLTPVLKESLELVKARAAGKTMVVEGVEHIYHPLTWPKEKGADAEPITPAESDTQESDGGSRSIFSDGRTDSDDQEPEACPECGGEVHTYKSRRGPDIRSCSFGRGLWLETFEKTKNKETANRAAKGHLYQLQP